MKQLYIITMVVSLIFVSAGSGFAAKDYEQWMSEAEDAYEQAEEYLDSSGNYKAVCYHSHQAVEKAMKGVLVGLNKAAGTGHRTADLNVRLIESFPILESYSQPLRELDKAYFSYVYPDTSALEFSRTDAKECISLAEEFAEFVAEQEEMFT